MNNSAIKRIMRRVNRIAAIKASATMLTEIIYFDPACPCCGELQSIPLMREKVAEALRRRDPIVLYSPCHDREWEASDMERRELGELVLTPLPDGAPHFSGLPFASFNPQGLRQGAGG